MVYALNIFTIFDLKFHYFKSNLVCMGKLKNDCDNSSDRNTYSAQVIFLLKIRDIL